MKTRAILLLMGAMSLAVSGLSAQSSKLYPDLVYGNANGVDLLLDLAVPDGEHVTGLRPAILVIHGGAWARGSRKTQAGAIEMFARQGYVAAAVSYRLVPDARFPAQIEDVKAAVRWMRKNAQRYGIDPDRIGATGHSSGGHLALMLAYTGPDDGLEGPAGWEDQPSSAVQAVVSFYAPTDFLTVDVPVSTVTAFLGGTRAEQPEAYRAASPVSYVSADSVVPVLLLHGDADPVVPVGQSYLLAGKLLAFGVPPELVVYPEEKHGFTEPARSEARSRMLEFFASRLKPER